MILQAADYRDYSQAGSWSWNNMHRDYSVSGIDYDANGNMLHMTQRGKGVNGTPVTIDSLFYEYDNGNKLLSVTDLGLESTPTIHDFDNSQASTSTYTYDGSGNLASDALKDLSLFYNHLNLPTEINNQASILSNAISSRKFDIVYYYIDSLKVNVHEPLLIRTEDSLYVQDFTQRYMNYEEGSENFQDAKRLVEHLERMGVEFDNYNYRLE